MSKKGGPENPMGSEAVAALTSAREAYRDFLQTSEPLRLLSYSPKQIQYAMPVLGLIEQEKAEISMTKGAQRVPCFIFSKPGNEDTSAEILPLVIPDGFAFHATRMEHVPDELLDSSSREHRLIQQLTWNNFPVKIFEDSVSQVAHILLMNPLAQITDLNYLAKQIISAYSISPIGKILPEAKLTAITRDILKTNTTYRAAWLDPETKERLALEVNYAPYGLKRDPVDDAPHISVYKIFTPRTLGNGNYIPIGKVANANQQKIQEAVNAQGNLVVHGSFAQEH